MNVIHESPFSCQTTLTYWCGCVYHPTIKPNHKTQKEKNINTKTKPCLYWCDTARASIMNLTVYWSRPLTLRRNRRRAAAGRSAGTVCLPASLYNCVGVGSTDSSTSIGRSARGRQTDTNERRMNDDVVVGFLNAIRRKKSWVLFFCELPFFKMMCVIRS